MDISRRAQTFVWCIPVPEHTATHKLSALATKVVDPITSMDYRRIHEVCDRIVALAHDHQVIVFTHNIWFAAQLLSQADKKSLKYYDIRLESGAAGVVTPGSHPRVDTVAQVRTIIKKLIEAADKADGEVKAALVEKGVRASAERLHRIVRPCGCGILLLRRRLPPRDISQGRWVSVIRRALLLVNHDLQILSDGPAFGGRARRVVSDHAGGFPVAGQH